MGSISPEYFALSIIWNIPSLIRVATHTNTHTRYPLLFCIHYRGGEMFIYNLLFIWTFRPWSVVCLNYLFFVNCNFITGDLFCFLCTLIKYTCSERQQYKLTCVLCHISVDHLYSNIPLLEVRILHFKKKSSWSWEKNNILEYTELFVINSVISCWCFWFEKEKKKQLVCLSPCCELLQQIISVSREQKPMHSECFDYVWKCVENADFTPDWTTWWNLSPSLKERVTFLMC